MVFFPEAFDKTKPAKKPWLIQVSRALKFAAFWFSD
jgi:hypothetical protein